MCLRLHEISKPNFINGKLKCYKIMHELYKYYSSAFYEKRSYKMLQWLISDREYKQLTEDEISTNNVYFGIHVYLNKDDAERERIRIINRYALTDYFDDLVLVECEALEEDLVTFGKNDSSNRYEDMTDGAVFMKVQLIQEIEQGE